MIGSSIALVGLFAYSLVTDYYDNEAKMAAIKMSAKMSHSKV